MVGFPIFIRVGWSGFTANTTYGISYSIGFGGAGLNFFGLLFRTGPGKFSPTGVNGRLAGFSL